MRLNRNRLVVAGILLVSAFGLTVAAGPSAASMAAAANAFLASLTPEQRSRATFAFDSSERMNRESELIRSDRIGFRL